MRETVLWLHEWVSKKPKQETHVLHTLQSHCQIAQHIGINSLTMAGTFVTKETAWINFPCALLTLLELSRGHLLRWSFFSGLMAGPTYHPRVSDHYPGTLLPCTFFRFHHNHLLYKHKDAIRSVARTTRPPITPPTIGPMAADLWASDVLWAANVEDNVGVVVPVSKLVVPVSDGPQQVV